jgi:addiction module HigA family antidote
MKIGHPGTYVKREILPRDLTVTAAAKTLGVGRPALSKFLNGHASLSPEMALRLERAFGARSEALLRMQAAYEEARVQVRAPAIAVRSFAPCLFNIKAMQIEAWSEQLESRSDLPAFVRRLVISTGKGLAKVDFPAFENSQRKGWDGEAISGFATPWIPLGRSGWEFGVNKDPARKAEDDFLARLKSVKPKARHETTFVFVTPRNWQGKEAWAAEKRSLGEWKDVRAFDASDLEQWLEGSPPAQAWLGERLPLGDNDVRTLERCWALWAEVTDPPLSKILFARTADQQGQKLVEWLSGSPDRLFTITAASKEEALAGLACVFESEAVSSKAPHASDRVLVVGTAKALAKVAAATSDTIIVLASAEAERESAGIHRKHHTIAITRRSSEIEADLIFDLVDSASFRLGLSDMGLKDDGIDRLRRECGYSQTVLRRRLSHVPDIRTPPWANDAEVAKRLIPLMFVGAWDATSEADQAVLAEIAAGSHDEIEKTVASLASSDQSPVWSVGRVRGVVSKVDAFYAVQSRITKADLDRFFEVAELVLSETDPGLELPEDKRWASSIYGKTRRHSDALREGICETLVLLAVHGNNLFKARLGVDIEARVNRFVFDLMTPFDPVTWQSQRNDLPRYAEAAPDIFLDILEQDLASSDPKVHALMQPTSAELWSSPSRSGLLWALESLAWNPKWLPRAVLQLAKLGELKLNDNWVNKPENSLLSIFRSWMPQTAATVKDRVALLEMLKRKHPRAAWSIYVDQFNPGSTIGHHSSRPRWRRDAIGAGEVVTVAEMHEAQIDAINKAIDWPDHTLQTLSDLVERLEILGPEFQERVWTKIEAWNAAGANDEEKATLREKIRSTALTRRLRKQSAAAKLRARARIVLDSLTPSDIVLRHLWLLAKSWVQESADELEEKRFDYRTREDRITRLRGDALREIWAHAGFVGIVRLCELSEAPHAIGWNLAASVLDNAAIKSFVHQVIERHGSLVARKIGLCLSGLMIKIDATLRAEILCGAISRGREGPAYTDDELAFLLRAAPFHGATWDLVDTLPNKLKRAYWKEVSPQKLFSDVPAEDVNRVVEELLEVERPRAAFFTVDMDFELLQSQRFIRLLVECGTIATEPTAHYQMERHNISNAFEVLSKRSDVPKEELARLEFLFIKALDHTKHGLKTLEEQLSRSPELFVQALTMLYKRQDGSEDPPELRPTNQDHAADLASAAYSLLHNIKKTPGTDPATGEVDAEKLRAWLARALELASDYSRRGVAESEIGQLLGRGPAGKDGIWPCEGVREVLEDVGTPEIARGMLVGVHNSRGATWRGEGGDQERALSAKHRKWSSQIGVRYPFTARMLEDIALSYDRDAERWDEDFEIRHRLEHCDCSATL